LFHRVRVWGFVHSEISQIQNYLKIESHHEEKNLI
jgi:hypothetical protein